MVLRLSCSMVCGIFPDQGLNPCLLRWQANSLPLNCQGGPLRRFKHEPSTVISIMKILSSLLCVRHCVLPFTYISSLYPCHTHLMTHSYCWLGKCRPESGLHLSRLSTQWRLGFHPVCLQNPILPLNLTSSAYFNQIKLFCSVKGRVDRGWHCA